GVLGDEPVAVLHLPGRTESWRPSRLSRTRPLWLVRVAYQRWHVVNGHAARNDVQLFDRYLWPSRQRCDARPIFVGRPTIAGGKRTRSVVRDVMRANVLIAGQRRSTTGEHKHYKPGQPHPEMLARGMMSQQSRWVWD